MDHPELLLLILAAVVIVVAVVLLAGRRKPGRQGVPTELVPAAVAPGPPAIRPQDDGLDAIVIGASPAAPMLTIRPVASPEAFGPRKPVDEAGFAAVRRLGPLLQTAPSLLEAKMALGKHLMKVKINGDLVRAADGNGLRAFAVGLDGRVTEQARLFDAASLQNLINANALWQVASVLVAQKHLADISTELQALEQGVASISRFLDNQRKARILATYEYVHQVYEALQAGELPESARHELESCERELIEIQVHLMAEYRQRGDQAVKGGMVGTKKTCRGIETKLEDLDLLAQDIAVCVETRIAAWRTLSLFPGNPQQTTARGASIQEAIEALDDLGSYGHDGVQREIASVHSFWHRAKTLERRRASLEDKNAETAQRLSDVGMPGGKRIMLDAGPPTHLLLYLEDGAVVSAEQRA